MQQQEPGWHLKIQTGMELLEKQGSMTWKESGDSFCSLPIYEQKQYCLECKRIGDDAARKIELEEQEAMQTKPKSVSEKVIEWHQKQLKIR